MKVQMVRTDSLSPYEKNPRKNKHAVDKVAASISEFGFRQPIVVDEAKVIIIGHTRWQAAKKLGLEKVPVHVATGMSEQDARRYRIADNRIGDEAEWDRELLSFEVSELAALSGDLSVLGFDAHELAELMGLKDAADVAGEWSGMPEFDQKDKTAYRTIPVHFKDQEGVDRFAELIGQKITDHTRFVWYPEIEIERYVDKVYEAEEGEAGEAEA